MINVADRLKPVDRSSERATGDGRAPDSAQAKADAGAPVRGYPAKNLVLENGQYRVADHDK